MCFCLLGNHIVGSFSTDDFFTPRHCSPTSYDLKKLDLSAAHIQINPPVLEFRSQKIRLGISKQGER